MVGVGGQSYCQVLALPLAEQEWQCWVLLLPQCLWPLGHSTAGSMLHHTQGTVSSHSLLGTAQLRSTVSNHSLLQARPSEAPA